MPVSLKPAYDGDDAVTILASTFDGVEVPDLYARQRGAPTDTLRSLTDYTWAEYCYLQGHATAEESTEPPSSWRDRPAAIYTVEPAWQAYTVTLEREADATPLDLDKTLAELGLTQAGRVTVRVRYARIVPTVPTKTPAKGD